MLWSRCRAWVYNKGVIKMWQIIGITIVLIVYVGINAYTYFTEYIDGLKMAVGLINIIIALPIFVWGTVTNSPILLVGVALVMLGSWECYKAT